MMDIPAALKKKIGREKYSYFQAYNFITVLSKDHLLSLSQENQHFLHSLNPF